MMRIAKLSDAAQIREIYAPIVEQTPISFEYVSPSIEQIEERIASTLTQYPWLVYEKDGRLLGYAYAGTFRSRMAYQWSTEVTVYVRPQIYRKGLGQILYRKLLEILARQAYRTALGVVTLPNQASVALHEALGFQKVGHIKNAGYKFQTWYDVGIWQLELSNYDSVVEPLSFRNSFFTGM